MAIWICYAGMMCVGIAVNIMPVLLTTVGVDVSEGAGLSGEQLGRIGAAIFAGVVAAIVITGPSADRLGAKPFAVLGNILVAIGLLLVASAHSYLMVLAAVFIMGLGSGILDMLLSPVVCVLLPERRAAAMNWLHAFYCIGAVATVIFASSLLAAGVGWRTIARWLALAPMLVGVAFATLRIPPLVNEKEQRTPLRVLIQDRYFRYAFLAIFLGGATELGMAQWLPAYAETALGFSKWTGGMALLSFSVVMGAGRMLAGSLAARENTLGQRVETPLQPGVSTWFRTGRRLVDGLLGHRADPITIMLRCCWGAIALVLLASFLGWPAPALAACILMGLAVSPLWPSTLGVVSERFPHGGASMFCLLAAAGNFGGMFMPWAIGAAADHSSMRLGLATLCLCPLLMSGLLVRMRGEAVLALGS